MRASATPSRARLALALVLVAGAAHAQPRAEDESRALVDEGREALRDARLDAAARALDQAIALNPRRIEAYVLRGAVHLARREHAAGVALLRRARALAPDNVDVQAMLGTLLIYDQHPAEGAPLLEAVIVREPKRYEARALLGKHHAARGEWAAAVVDLEAYLAARPAGLAVEDPAYWIDLADAYLRSHRPAPARDLFARALAARPRDVRGRVGLAWATAAIDCKRARPLLAGLADLAPTVPAIGLVTGRCALALGDADAALTAGRRYLALAPKQAIGHGLVGDALLARGDAAGARDAYGRAQALEPGARRWGVRRAGALRRAGDPAGAVAALDQLGAPARPVDDPAWWRELARALVAGERLAEVVDRVAPVAATLDDAAVFAALGEAELARAHPELAVGWLDRARGRGAGDDVTALLARALAATGTARLRADDLAGAEADLARAAALPTAPSASALRNLGVARLAAGKPALARTALEQAIAVAPDAPSWVLHARAATALGELAVARASYAKARDAARGGDAVDVAIEVAGFELAAGEPAAAVAALEAAPRGDARHAAALATARHAAGLAALRAGQAARAIALLDLAAKDARGDEARAVACDRALATVAGGDRDLALRQLRALGSAPCPFPAPADVQAVPILTALNDGLRARRAEAALAKLGAIQRTATGAARALAATAVRVVALRAADEAYRAGDLRKARRYLASARAVESRLGADELAHNQAAIELASGKLAAAIPVLERIAPRVPEALINLGIAYDRQGEPTKALDAWRRARRAGVGFAPLGDWIDAKERIYGAEVTPVIRRVLIVLVMLASVARADGVVVGLFAPTSPFAGTAARVEFATRLGKAIGAAIGEPGIGRVYGKAGDFAAALRKGEVQVAVVDATYLAATGAGGNVVAVGVRGGDASVGWVLVARGAGTVLELRGKTVLVPSVGGREGEFVRNGLYGGELGKDFFGAIEAAPDAASALTSLGLGKADAAVVPAGAAPPAGASVIATFAPISLPVVVVTGVDDATRAKIVAALVAFEGDAALGGFRAGGGEGVKAMARRMSPAERRGPMALPDVRIGFGELLSGRGFALPKADVKAWIAPIE